MAIIPIRRLGDIGIITDVNPYDLPPNALSQGNNLRFDNGKITRSPVFKSMIATTAATPVFCFTRSVAGETDKIGVVDITGSIYFFQNGAETDVTPASFTPASSTEPHTSCSLGNVSYINRNTAVPMYYGPASTDFDELPNWPATYTCKALRAFKSYLIALNITKAGAENPTMIKWSDITVTNSYPASWDETDPTLSAGEKPLDELTTPLLDGLALRDAFILYGEDQVHLLEYTADQEVFRSRKIFDGPGIINTNCVVEWEGKHFVFGKNDIYIHDGIQYKSIISGKNKEYVFNSLNQSLKGNFFVSKNEDLGEIMFNYVSGDAQAGFLETTYPNRSAVFNPENGTWAFRDLPNVGSSTNAVYSTSLTWTSATTETWADIGTSWTTVGSAAPQTMFFVSASSTTAGITDGRLIAYDTIIGGNISAGPLAELNKEAWAERIGIDMDETGEQIRAYKNLKTIYPQANAKGGTGNLLFTFGATEYGDLEPSLSGEVDFNPTTSHKVDVRAGGRYLAWRVDNPTNFQMELSGFDADVVATGRR